MKLRHKPMNTRKPNPEWNIAEYELSTGIFWKDNKFQHRYMPIMRFRSKDHDAAFRAWKEGDADALLKLCVPEYLEPKKRKKTRA